MTEVNSWKLIEPDNYYRSFISKKERPDGRDFNTARPVSVKVGSIGTAEGSSTVKIGSTTIVCGIKAEICSPSLQNPNIGFLVPNVELYPCASPHFKAGPPGEKAIATSQFLNGLLQDGSIIDLNTLCIKESKFVWCLFIDLICLDFDGNLMDSCVMAMLAALIDLKLPDVCYNEETENITLEETERTITVKDRPLSVTFGVYNNDLTLLDCNALDESECNGEVSVVLSPDGSIISTRKTGGIQISCSDMQELIKKSAPRIKYLNSTLDEAISSKTK